MIESIVDEKENMAEKEYPKLMIDNDGLIILFHSHRSGIVVSAGNDFNRNIGDYESDWTSTFKDFHGKVTLISK